MFWIALELSIPKIGFNIMLSLTAKELDEFEFDGVVESDNTDEERRVNFLEFPCAQPLVGGILIFFLSQYTLIF